MSLKPLQEEARWHRRAMLLLLGILLVRIGYAWIYPFDLSGDEAYYWDWGRHLDWGYYSKPPLIGWIMALLRFLHFDSGAGIRTASALIGTGTLSLIYLLSAKLFSPRTGFWAVCVTTATIGNVALNICMTTDAPLALCWCGALYSFWRFTEKAAFRWSILLMLFLGIGALAKQMMLVFFPVGVLFLLLSPGKRNLFRQPLLWMTWLGSLLFLIPSLWWNSQHGWITFQHTSSHLHGDLFSWLKALLHLLEFAASQLALATPVTFVIMVFVFVLLFRDWKNLCDEERYLLLFSAPPLMIFLLFSFHRRINPNWPLVFYLPGLTLLAGVCCRSGGRLFHWFKRGIATGAVMVTVFYVLLAVLPLTGLDTTRIVPLREISGWSLYGAAVGRIHHQMPDPEHTQLITVGHRYHTAALAFYHPDRPTVYHWNSNADVSSQYDLWPGPPHNGSDALIIVAGGGVAPPELASRFALLTRLKDIEIPSGSRRPKQYSLYFGASEK